MNNNEIARDRFLASSSIRYDCRSLYISFLEMHYTKDTDTVNILFQYPSSLFEKDKESAENFLNSVKQLAFPYKKTQAKVENQKKRSDSCLIQYHPFVLIDQNGIRKYGYCRSSNSGNHINCLISYLPWYNIFVSLLDKISNVTKENKPDHLYNFLEALYEYELPGPNELAEIISHDGLEYIKFKCPDRRNLPSMNKNRNLFKFFAFFDLDKIIKIFTALLLERKILIVSKDLENLTSIALALEHLIYPLEWFHLFTPMLPEEIDLLLLNIPSPFIYGTHTDLYQKLDNQIKNECFIILVDERQIINGDRDHLPKNVNDYLHKKLLFFDGDNYLKETVKRSNSKKMNSLLQTDPLKAFRDSVLMLICDYRSYIKCDPETHEYQNDYVNHIKNAFSSKKSIEFYENFKNTQAFSEFCNDRCEYLKSETEFKLIHPGDDFHKDFIEILCENFKAENIGHKHLMLEIPKVIDKAYGKFLNSAHKYHSKVNFFEEKIESNQQEIDKNISNEAVSFLSECNENKKQDDTNESNSTFGNLIVSLNNQNHEKNSNHSKLNLSKVIDRTKAKILTRFPNVHTSLERIKNKNDKSYETLSMLDIETLSTHNSNKHLANGNSYFHINIPNDFNGSNKKISKLKNLKYRDHEEIDTNYDSDEIYECKVSKRLSFLKQDSCDDSSDTSSQITIESNKLGNNLSNNRISNESSISFISELKSKFDNINLDKKKSSQDTDELKITRNVL